MVNLYKCLSNNNLNNFRRHRVLYTDRVLCVHNKIYRLSFFFSRSFIPFLNNDTPLADCEYKRLMNNKTLTVNNNFARSVFSTEFFYGARCDIDHVTV